MKSSTNTRILKLALVEILAQCGFDKTAEQALNVLADIMRHYIEHLAARIRKSSPGGVSELVCRVVVEDLYRESEYQEPELLSFLRYQLNVKTYLSDRYNIDSEESLLHILRVLPKNVHLKSFVRSSRSLSDPNEAREESVEEGVGYDDFMRDFVESSLSEQSRRVEGRFEFQTMDLVDGCSRGIAVDRREFNEILQRRGVGFLQEPVALVDDLALWTSRHVFKDCM